jgi:hypothetical protein
VIHHALDPNVKEPFAIDPLVNGQKGNQFQVRDKNDLAYEMAIIQLAILLPLTFPPCPGQASRPTRGHWHPM